MPSYAEMFGNPMDDMSPTDALKLRMELANKPVAPEQAATNRRSNLYEALSMTPGPGNVIAAQDAYTGAGDAYKAFQGGNYKQSALAAALAGLSGFGAVTGLPVGKMASSVARNAPSTLFSGAGPVGKSNTAIASEIEREIRGRLSKDGDAYYGMRITENPLEVGQPAPPSKNWYADFISDDHHTFGREAFPDHGTDLPGPSVVGMSSDRDIEKALKAANLLPSHYYYPGNHISLIRGDKRIHGEDPGEWIMPGGEVVASWVKE